jgi:Mat/Ecp fimbriae major subunit
MTAYTFPLLSPAGVRGTRSCLCRGVLAIAGLVAASITGTPSALAANPCDKALSITETAQMNFGTIGPTSSTGHVTLSPSGAVTGPFGYYLAGPANAGAFSVRGSNNCTVTISFTPGSLSGSSPSSSMTITNFTSNTGPTAVLTNGGRLTFSVGADLVVNSGQPGGTYNGTYGVTVVY